MNPPAGLHCKQKQAHQLDRTRIYHNSACYSASSRPRVDMNIVICTEPMLSAMPICSTELHHSVNILSKTRLGGQHSLGQLYGLCICPMWCYICRCMTSCWYRERSPRCGMVPQPRLCVPKDWHHQVACGPTTASGVPWRIKNSCDVYIAACLCSILITFCIDLVMVDRSLVAHATYGVACSATTLHHPEIDIVSAESCHHHAANQPCHVTMYMKGYNRHVTHRDKVTGITTKLMVTVSTAVL